MLTTIAWLNDPEPGYLTLLLQIALRTVYFTGIIITIWFVLYYPLIWIVRKLWKRYSERKNFANPQTPRIINRFIQDTGAMFGTVTLLLAFIIFITAHLIAPDHTPNAGFQVNEIAFKPPGFYCTMLQVPLERTPEKSSLLSWMISGKELSYRLVPIKKYWFAGDSIYVERYLDAEKQGDVRGYSYDQILRDKQTEDPQEEIIRNAVFTKYYVLGTDDLGRDYLSRILLGVRVSLAVGSIAVIIALLIGIPIGAAAGFFKKEPPAVVLRKRRFSIPVDNILMWFMSVIWSVPALLLVFPIVFAFGQQYYTIFIAVGLTMWVDIARLVRGQVMQVREMEFITATKNFGYSNFRTVFLHILPNISGPVIVITAANFAYAILTEAGLSFLGIGVQAPAPSWGLMISKYKDNLITDPYLALIPGIAITLLVLAFFMIGNGLRDALDIKSQAGNAHSGS